MKKTTIDKSLIDFSFEIYYLNSHIDIKHIGNPNYDDVIFVRCYPKWDMSEQVLKQSIEYNKSLLFAKMEEISNQNDLFYCYFDIDFSFIKGTTTNIIENKVRWIEARPEIKKKNTDCHPKGFINAGELPPEN